MKQIKLFPIVFLLNIVVFVMTINLIDYKLNATKKNYNTNIELVTNINVVFMKFHFFCMLKIKSKKKI